MTTIDGEGPERGSKSWLASANDPRWFLVQCKPEAARVPFAALREQLMPALKAAAA